MTSPKKVNASLVCILEDIFIPEYLPTLDSEMEMPQFVIKRYLGEKALVLKYFNRRKKFSIVNQFK